MANNKKKSQEKTKSRVNIVYEVDGNPEKKVSLPFVMGVMADLRGKRPQGEEQVSVEKRKFTEFTQNNFDDRMKAMKPRVAFQVPNALTGQGNLNVEVTFESMDDFSPAAVARRVGPLAGLLKVREQVSNLLSHMDGNSRAEEKLAEILNDPALLQALASAPKDQSPEAK
jgi:type VI secretion system protein ImpB